MPSDVGNSQHMDHGLVSIIQAPGCGATVCRTHQSLELRVCCDGNYTMLPESGCMHNCVNYVLTRGFGYLIK